MSTKPLVSVIIPTFNRLELTQRAVQSVLSQTLAATNIEVIVVDDGSTEDQSGLQELVESHGGKFVYQNSSGVSAARNFGVTQANGQWIAFLDSDDQWHAEKLEKQVEALSSVSLPLILHCEEIWIRKGKRVNPKNIHAKASGNAFARCLELCCISPSAVMISRELFLENGGFDEQMRVCEDYDLWIRLSAGHPIKLLNEALVTKYGGHEDQLSASEPAMDRFRVFSLIKNYLSLDLSEVQQELLFAELKKKLKVLIQGAVKRGNVQSEQIFSKLNSSLSSRDELMLAFKVSKESLLNRQLYETSCN